MSQPVSPPPALAPPVRFAVVDLARGVALLAMFVFHFAYDLSYFGLIAVDVPVDPAWRLFARGIAGSFLILVGVSLVLATRGRLNRPAFLKRLAMVAGAATLVTIATRFAMPDNVIAFGILHHIAVASVLGLLFLRLPVPGLLVAALAAYALPALIAPEALDRPWLAWLGFAQNPPRAADFVPLFPWFGNVLTGMLLARLALPRLGDSALALWRPRSGPARLIAWGGRHSLIVYLLHQPVFIAALMLAQQTPLARPTPERGFSVSCQRSCAGGAPGADACRALCACTVDALKRENLWDKTVADRLDADETVKMEELARACLRPR